MPVYLYMWHHISHVSSENGRVHRLRTRVEYKRDVFHFSICSRMRRRSKRSPLLHLLFSHLPKLFRNSRENAAGLRRQLCQFGTQRRFFYVYPSLRCPSIRVFHLFSFLSFRSLLKSSRAHGIEQLKGRGSRGVVKKSRAAAKRKMPQYRDKK